MAKRMRLIDNGASVHLTYYDLATREEVKRFFWINGKSGYVREKATDIGARDDWDFGHRQVCERLSHRGTTLIANTDNLGAVIRREYKRMRARWLTDRKFSWSP